MNNKKANEIFKNIRQTATRNAQKVIRVLLYILFRPFPLKNKVVATSFYGDKFADNTRRIVEELHKLNDSIDIVWIKDVKSSYEVPDYIRLVDDKPLLKRFYEYYTAKVWLDTHHISYMLNKKKNQLFIDTWHGGAFAIKKIGKDQNKFASDDEKDLWVTYSAKIASLYISNSDFLSNLYRSAFGRKGPVWKCGYPRNDILLEDKSEKRSRIREKYGLKDDTRILLYAPTFRDNDYYDVNGMYGLDLKRLHAAIQKRFGGEWAILVRLHPFVASQGMTFDHEMVFDATDHPDMQELICGCDAFLTDYSSGVFDAAFTGIPCFTYAVDFEEYKAARGVYAEMDELPFPYARNNDELEENILGFDEADYGARWKAFADDIGLYETGHAARDVARVVNEFIKGNKKPLEEITG